MSDKLNINNSNDDSIRAISKENQIEKDLKIAKNIKRAGIAFIFSGLTIIFLIITECYITYKHLDAIVNKNSWHVMLIFILGFNSLILGLLYFNQSAWTNKKFSSKKAYKAMLPIVKLITNKNTTS